MTRYIAVFLTIILLNISFKFNWQYSYFLLIGGPSLIGIIVLAILFRKREVINSIAIIGTLSAIVLGNLLDIMFRSSGLKWNSSVSEHFLVSCTLLVPIQAVVFFILYFVYKKIRSLN